MSLSTYPFSSALFGVGSRVNGVSRDTQASLAQGGSRASRETLFLQRVLGLSQGLLLVRHGRTTSLGRRPGGICKQMPKPLQLVPLLPSQSNRERKFARSDPLFSVNWHILILSSSPPSVVTERRLWTTEEWQLATSLAKTHHICFTHTTVAKWQWRNVLLKVCLSSWE